MIKFSKMFQSQQTKYAIISIIILIFLVLLSLVIDRTDNRGPFVQTNTVGTSNIDNGTNETSAASVVPVTPDVDYTAFLIARGVPKDAITIIPTSEGEALEVASAYFSTEYLPRLGVPQAYIESVPTSRSEADKVAIAYFTAIYLPENGVPEEHISGSPKSRSEADEIAVRYFISVYLPENGTPDRYIIGSPHTKQAADIIASDYFVDIYLPQNGVPEQFIVGKPISLSQANEIGGHYFKDIYLHRNGVPEAYITGVPISQEAADRIATTYFRRVYLPSKGVARRYIVENDVNVRTKTEADQIAVIYFVYDYLAERDVPHEYVEIHGIFPMNRAIANDVYTFYSEEQALNALQASLVEDLIDNVVPTVEREQKKQIRLFESQIVMALGEEVVIISEKLGEKIKQELEEIRNALEISIAATTACTTGTALIPGFGDLVDFVGALRGIDSCSGETMSTAERVVTGLLSLMLVSELSKVDNIADIARSIDSLRDVYRAAQGVDVLAEANELRRLASRVGRFDEMDGLLKVATDLQWTDDLSTVVAQGRRVQLGGTLADNDVQNIVEAGRVLEANGTMDAIVSAEESLDAGTQALMIVPVLEQLDDTTEAADLSRLMDGLENFDQRDAVGRVADSAAEVPHAALDDPEAFGAELPFLASVLRYSGVADDVYDAIAVLERSDKLKEIIAKLPWRDYIEMAAKMEKKAQTESWRIWALENIVRACKPYRIGLRVIGEQIVAYTAQAPNGTMEIWEFKYVGEDEVDHQLLENQVDQELAALRPEIRGGANVYYTFTEEPPPTILEKLNQAEVKIIIQDASSRVCEIIPTGDSTTPTPPPSEPSPPRDGTPLPTNTP